MAADKWTAARVGDQTDRVAVITGGNTGIGFETARVLAARGATVVLACRSPERAAAAASRIGPAARVVALDLADLASVRAGAGELRAAYPRIDLLINNAGVMFPPLTRTADGIELQFGTNHLGHFALTGLLLPALLAAPAARIVTVSSNGHRATDTIDLDDPGWERRRYHRQRAYAASKLANLLFTDELHRRLTASGARAIAVAAHPGGVRTELTRHSPVLHFLGGHRSVRWIFRMLVQAPDAGALPTLRAATDPGVTGGDYYGPDGWGEWTGHPVRVERSAAARSDTLRTRLWDVSTQLTGVSYPPVERPAAAR